ncbi:hypothetical protein CTEN210_16464 [Chaetoceros tenuissimus]|uniref:Erythromycin biosynthesis protein CIII-like C-terminal domain-containing protein n=1 Tax=Chaetoceros tenuissimus TaxID=426638 RepID=A0AAD3HEF7_9STRA|nr:hypothetical protein CTEN210_16464 [Chaetoceros tenuissimus]
MTTAVNNKKKLVSIINAGSRGDLQPFVGMALELSKYYRVRILTNAGSSQKFVESFPHLEYAEIWPDDAQQTLQTNQGLRHAMAEGNAFKFFQIIDELDKKNAPMTIKNFLNEMKNHRPDLLITGPLAAYMHFYAERILKFTVINLQLQTIGYNPHHASLGLPTLPFGMHYYLILFVIKGVFKGFAKYNEVAIKLGQPTLNLTEKEFMKEASNSLKGFGSQKSFICQSPLFRNILRPNVDPERYIYTGACTINAKQQTKFSANFGGDQCQQQITAFLDKDKKNKPVYIGFGSMLGQEPRDLVLMSVTALMYADERGIILAGTAGLSFELLCIATDDQNVIAYAKNNILFVNAVSHEWLFPKLKCTVHHGGSGTTQAALRSGVPTIVTPVYLDQFCHSHVVNQLGVGTGFRVSMKKINYINLGLAIKAVQSEQITLRCKEVSTIIRKENGNEFITKIVKERLVENGNSPDASTAKLQLHQAYILPELVMVSLKMIMIACILKFCLT